MEIMDLSKMDQRQKCDLFDNFHSIAVGSTYRFVRRAYWMFIIGCTLGVAAMVVAMTVAVLPH